MKETVGSLRAYFIVAGLLSGAVNALIVTAALSKNVPVLALMGGVGVVLALAFLYVGINLQKLLVEGLNVITAVVLCNLAFLILSFLLIYSVTDPETAGGQMVKYGIGVVICVYLLNNAKRLSAEEIEKMKPREEVQPPQQ
jgi:hypothetical protein